MQREKKEKKKGYLTYNRSFNQIRMIFPIVPIRISMPSSIALFLSSFKLSSIHRLLSNGPLRQLNAMISNQLLVFFARRFHYKPIYTNTHHTLHLPRLYAWSNRCDSARTRIIMLDEPVVCWFIYLFRIAHEERKENYSNNVQFSDMLRFRTFSTGHSFANDIRTFLTSNEFIILEMSFISR